MNEDERAETDANGYYEILVPDNGALVFKAGLNKAILEKVSNRMKIDVEVDDGIYLKEVVVTGELKQIQPEPKASRLIGNRFYPYNTFLVTWRRQQVFASDCTAVCTELCDQRHGGFLETTGIRRQGISPDPDPTNGVRPEKGCSGALYPITATGE